MHKVSSPRPARRATLSRATIASRAHRHRPALPATRIRAGQCIAGGQSAPSGGPWVLIIEKSLGVRTALDLDGATICTVPGTPSVAAITAYFQSNGMNFTPVAVSSGSAARDTYLKNACDVLIADDKSSAPALRSLTPAGAHLILPERIFAVGAAPPVQQSLPAPAPPPPVNLAYPLQSELKRVGCLTGAVDGIWGGGSRAALNRFAQRAGLSLGSEPSQNALNEARRRQPGFCQPVRVAPRPPTYQQPVTQKKRCSAIKFAFTRGNTCACSGGRIFTGVACEDPNDLVPVQPQAPLGPIGPGECRRMGNEIVCS